MDAPLVFDVNEQTTPKYTATITDDAGAVIPAASLLTLTLTFYVIKSDGSISYIRGAFAAGQNVLNANNVTVDANGLLTWALQVADTTLVEALDFERHYALFNWTWGSSRRGKHLVIFNVQHLLTVT